MKKSLLCLVLVLFTALFPAASFARETARGFDTPQACAQAVFEALKTQDLDLMEACVAFDELAASFDYQAQADRLQAALGYSSFLPATDAFSCAFNAALLRRSWYVRVTALILRASDLELAELLFSGVTYPAATDEYAQILEAVDTLDTDNVLGDFEYLGTIAPEEIAAVAEAYASERNQETLRRIMRVWGDRFLYRACPASAANGKFRRG